MTKRKETDKQFLRRIDRTMHKRPKDGGPTRADMLRAIDLRRRKPVSEAA